MANIKGIDFSLFWDIDRGDLSKLPFDGRVRWLHERVKMTLLEPLRILEEAQERTYPWLVITELVCSGIEALGGFHADGLHGSRMFFCGFVHDFMSRDFAKSAPEKNGTHSTYCEHLWGNFRNALSHGFALEWGGLWHSNESGLPGYLRPNKIGEGLAICPRSLLADFRQAVDAHFARLLADGEASRIGASFQRRFQAILTQQGRTR